MTIDPWDVDRGRVPAALDQWSTPGRVEIADGQLRWSYSGPGARPVVPPRDLLDRFVGLAEAPDAVIQNFAENYGVLYLCKHDRPNGHTKSDGPVTVETGGYARCKLRMVSPGVYEEPLQLWREWSRKMGAALRLAINLHGQPPTDDEDWLILYPELREVPRPDPNAPLLGSIEGQRHSLSLFVTGCTHEAQVELSFGWLDGPPVVSIGGRSLFAALSIRLLLAASRTEGLALCASCRTPHVPKRQPRIGERQYCSSCGTRAAQRDASADYRRRKKAGVPSTKRRRRAFPGGDNTNSSPPQNLAAQRR